MGFYGIENPPARSQGRSPRRLAYSGTVVVHTAEIPPDNVGDDWGAENTAAYISSWLQRLKNDASLVPVAAQ